MANPSYKQTEDVTKRIATDEDPLETDNRALELIGEDNTEGELEAEELREGEERDVVNDLRDVPETQRILPDPSLIPEGMEKTARIDDEDEETDDDKSI